MSAGSRMAAAAQLCCWLAVAPCGAALAADLPVPAPAPLPSMAFDVHGFSNTSVKNDYITPRGLLVTNAGATIQTVDILSVGIFKNPTGTLSSVTLFGGTFIDANPGYRFPNRTAYNEIDYFGGVELGLGRNWTVSASYVQFDSPQSAFFVERNAEFVVKYDDSGFNKGLSIHPYAKLFYTFKGKSSTVVTGNTDTFDVEIGAIPSYDLAPFHLPIVLTAPTWFTVGPSEFWGGAGHFGVFSTGLVATVPLPSAAALGAVKLSLTAGVQYLHILNDRLLLAQQLVGTAGAATHTDVVVPSVGLIGTF